MRPFSLTAKGATDVGRVRESNQDSFLIDQSLGLLIVADGMGGHAGGEIASRVATTEVQAFHSKFLKNHSIEKLSEEAVCSHLAEAVNHASSKIYSQSLEDPSLKGMGTTVTLAKFIDDKAYCAHVGDSRLYLIRSKFIYQITTDHSWVNEQIQAGNITEEEAEVHRLKNVITRSVGYQEQEDVDTTCFEISKGDCILICSDGLHGKVQDREISSLVIERGHGAVPSLIELANNRGGDDNITTVIATVS